MLKKTKDVLYPIQMRLEEAAEKLLNKQNIHNHSFIVYRLTRGMQLPFSVLMDKRALGYLKPSYTQLKQVLYKIPFVKIIDPKTIRLIYKDNFRRVLVTGLLKQKVQQYLQSFSKKLTLLNQQLSMAICCQSKEQAQNLCLHLRHCKRISQIKQQKIKANQYIKIRISIEASRLQSLLTQFVQNKRQQKFIKDFSSPNKGVYVRSVLDFYQVWYGRRRQGKSSTKPDQQCSSFDNQGQVLRIQSQTHSDTADNRSQD